jgi:DNA repair protein RadD
MPLRYYQREAVNAVFDYWDENAGHPLIEMATGTGKSMTLATLFQELIVGWPDMRLMCCTHVQELVEANYIEMIGIYPFAPVGIYAAALGRRDARAQIVFGQLQTVYSKANQIGHVDVLAIDEVHLVPSASDTMYRTFIDALLAINPDMKIVGLSATPYRLDSGRLDEGEDKLFDRVVYTYGIRQGIDDGYLTPITSKPTQTRQDTSSVPMRGGDLSKSDLQKAVDKEWLNRQILDEVLQTEGARRKALFFCAGIEHATHMSDLVKSAGKTCEVLHGGTPKADRRKIIEALKCGSLWGVTNDNVMSTGTNVPGIDLIIDMARTKSASRYVQRVGRGTRVIYPPGFKPDSVEAAERRSAIAGYIKPNCRYMDFAGNISEHGPVDMIEPHKPQKGEGTAPIKLCPQCEEQLHASVRTCWCCGHEFIFAPEEKLQTVSTDKPIISTGEPEWRQVTKRVFKFHEGKGEKPPSVKTTYICNYTPIDEWLCPEHQGYARSKAQRWWILHGGGRPFPKTVLEWLERQNELNATDEISVAPDGKYWRVHGHRPSQQPANDNQAPAANDNYEVPRKVYAGSMSAADWAALGDEIPF